MKIGLNSKNNKEIMQQKIEYKYTAENHFKHRLHQYQGIDKVDDTTILIINNKLTDMKLQKTDLTKELLKDILKSMNMIEYYDDIPSILNHINPHRIQTVKSSDPECPIC